MCILIYHEGRGVRDGVFVIGTPDEVGSTVYDSIYIML